MLASEVMASSEPRMMVRGVPSVKFTVPPVPSEKVMVFAPAMLFAFATACRREPVPLSLTVVTRKLFSVIVTVALGEAPAL